MTSQRSYLFRLQRWWHSPVARLACVLGVGVHLAGFLLFRVTARPVSAEEIPQPFIVWNGPDHGVQSEIRREQSLLLDSEALFLPTTLNARGVQGTQRVLSPGAALLEMDTPLPLVMNLSWGGQGDGSQGPLNFNDLLTRYARDSFTTYGQTAPPPPPLVTKPDAYLVEVRDASTGRLVGEFPLDPGEAVLPSPGELEALEFMLYRSAAGNVGSLLPLSQASAGETGRAWARLIESAGWELELPQGYYRLVVSP
ncbi:hypothetical protein [Ruficoccus sp. ZRK36]|uniref:hypothetical protein n=1 Tax=Ruficoccus sp. ZRK36 TaxID=2866311 RepID=UPI001C738978|nr:hypothetical protein [Ruficoccus sp. ZRK36]QYY34964.1 hypothetical protein K0V07_11700 [Ruficoccus sp. ZRK36]